MFLSVFDKWTFSREQKVCKWNIAAARQIGDLHIIGIFICSSYELPKTCCCDLCIHLWTLHMKWGKLSNTQMNSYYLYLCLLVDSTLKNRQVFCYWQGCQNEAIFAVFWVTIELSNLVMLLQLLTACWCWDAQQTLFQT